MMARLVRPVGVDVTAEVEAELAAYRERLAGPHDYDTWLAARQARGDAEAVTDDLEAARRRREGPRDG